MNIDRTALERALQDGAATSADLFAQLRAPWPQGGVHRDTYGPGEQRAHELVRMHGEAMGLESSVDFAGNLVLTWPGRDRAAPVWITGSHLDSVPEGGNFDGAAGVVAGLAAVAALRQLGFEPAGGITVMAIRGEEASSWYQGDFDSHVGSRAALGLAHEAELLRARRISDGRSMHELMRAAGMQPEQVRPGHAAIDPARCKGFIELHIEQGPVLVNRMRPVGLVSAIRGSARARRARCLGEYAHSGAVPHELRKDALLAACEFCTRMDEAWTDARTAGKDLVFTVGRFFTDASAHSITKVPGEVSFSIDLRSQESSTLHEMCALAQDLAARISQRRSVQIDLGPFNVSEPAVMDAALLDSLRTGSAALGLDALLLPSGAGHDAQDFARAGIPSAMIFVRNDKGSHNPDEAMDMQDFLTATGLLAWQLTQ